MSTLVELRPERRLLDHGFEGYKLSLAALAHWSHELGAPPDTHQPAEPQYSFLHAKLFALHQHLRADPHHHSHLLYYIDSTHHVRAVCFDAAISEYMERVVYDIPAHVERKPGHFNPCLFLPSADLAVVSDGTGYLHIVSAEQRSDLTRQWRTLHSQLTLDGDKYFVIIDCRIQERNEEVLLHCLLESIEQSEERFSTVLTWVTFQNAPECWKIISTKVIKGKGAVHYAAIETSCLAVYIASDNRFKFIFDSDNDVNEAPKDEERKIIYTWLQTADDVTITLKLPENFSKDNVHINIGPTSVKISYAGNTFVDGNFRHRVDSELTTWNIQDDGKLDILVTKLDSTLWDELIAGGDRSGEQILDAALVEEAHRRLAHLCSETEVPSEGNAVGFSTQELEECDAASEEDTTLVRLDGTDHTVTHRVPLSVHQYLFSVNLEPQEAPALALRHDVDACVWQPYAQLVNRKVWPVKHHGTLMAFGYVQSSKQNKKFVTCSPNFAYSVVCEASRHVFVYRASAPSSHGCELRKRGDGVTKNINIGQQHVFNIDKYGEVLGIYASNEYLFILTTTTLMTVEII